LQEKIKKIYDRKAKADKFQVDGVVLKWNARMKRKASTKSSKMFGRSFQHCNI